jgi:hypothetical protein
MRKDATLALPISSTPAPQVARKQRPSREPPCWQYFYSGRDMIAVLELTPDGWTVKDPKGVVLGTFTTREFAIAFINATVADPKPRRRSRSKATPSGMQTKRIPKPIWRSKLARGYRKTRKAQRQRQRRRERHAAEYAAYEARQPELIKKEKMEGGRG